MARPSPVGTWLMLRELRGNVGARGRAARSRHPRTLAFPTSATDRVVDSVCPSCEVGCGQKPDVLSEQVVRLTGASDSPNTSGRHSPKGAQRERMAARAAVSRYRASTPAW